VATVLAAIAVVITGLAAGLSLDRAVVAMPAWRRVGLGSWAAFTRQADLRNGLVLYPAVGVGSLACLILTVVVLNLDGVSPEAATPVYIATALAIPPLLVTGLAAPNILKLRRGDEPTLLRDAFDGFEQWHAIRAVLQLLLLGAAVWALTTVSGA
jgi:hypothetical protein